MAKTLYSEEVGLQIPEIRTLPRWSLGTAAGGTIFTSGQPGRQKDGSLVSPEPGPQTRQALRNLQAIIEAGGSSFAEATKVRIFLNQPSHRDVVVDEFLNYCAERCPRGLPAVTIIAAPASVEATHLEIFGGFQVEIEAFASVTGNRRVIAGETWADAVEADDLVFVAGQSGEGSDPGAQATNALGRISELLGELGLGQTDIVKLNTYFAEGTEQATVADARRTFFAGSSGGPACTDVIARLPQSGAVIVEAFAARGGKSFVGARGGQADAVQVGPWTFVAGQRARDAGGELVGPGDAKAQTSRVLENLHSILASGGGSFGHVAHVTVWFEGPHLYEALNEVRQPFYDAHFPAGDFPASTAVPGPSTVGGELLQIEAIAYRDR